MAKETETNQNSEKTDESNNVIDMLLSKNQIQTLDSETMILETQKRVWGASKKRISILWTNRRV